MHRTCQLCGGVLGILGHLGRLTHWLCRHCGMLYSTPRVTDDEA